MDLPLDVKFIIASFDIDVWIRLSFIDDEFKQFSYSVGRKLFIDLFTIMKIGNFSTTWKIFDKIHSFDDKPARIYPDGTKKWYCNDNLHRDERMPAIIYPDCEQHWYQYGERHRDNNLPAIIYPNGTKSWYQNGKFIKSTLF